MDEIVIQFLLQGGALALLALVLFYLGKFLQACLLALGRIELSIGQMLENTRENKRLLEANREDTAALRAALRLISESKGNGSTPEAIRRGYESAAVVLKKEEKDGTSTNT